MKQLKKISRIELKEVKGGWDPLPPDFGVCYVNREYIPTPCSGLCPNGTQPLCAF